MASSRVGAQRMRLARTRAGGTETTEVRPDELRSARKRSWQSSSKRAWVRDAQRRMRLARRRAGGTETAEGTRTSSVEVFVRIAAGVVTAARVVGRQAPTGEKNAVSMSRRHN